MENPRALLVKHRLKDLLRLDEPHKVITLRQDASVEQALRTLAARRILSAPVLTEDNDICGFLDIRDILSSFLDDVQPSQLEGKMLQRMRVLEEAGVRFTSKSIKQLSTLGGDGGFLHQSAEKGATILELVLDGFLHPKESRKAMHGGEELRSVVHRCAIFNKEGNITHIVSQSDVVRFLSQNSESLGPLGEMTVEQLGWAQRDVITVTPELAAIDAMRKMHEANIGAVGVIGDGGKLIGNFSVSELRTIISEHFGSLALPVGEFLALEHGTEYHGYAIHSDPDGVAATASPSLAWAKDRRQRGPLPGQEVGQHIICCNPTATLKEVLHLLEEHRLHRLYVVMPETLKPIGLITLSSVLRKVCEEGTGAYGSTKP